MKSFTPLLVLGVALTGNAAYAQLFSEGFNYANGDLVAGNAAWVNHSGATYTLDVSNGQAVINQNDTASGGADLHRLLGTSINGQTDNTTELFYGMTVNFTALPNAVGSYFAHFINDDDNTPFLARLGANTEGAAAGLFRLSVQNSNWAAADNKEFPLDLSLNVSYDVVVRYSFATDQTTLWVNPASDASTSVSATDAVNYATGAPQGVNFNAFALRQGTSTGTPTGVPGDLLIDDLRVGTSFNEVFPITPVPEPEEYAAMFAASLGAFALLRRRFARK